MLVDGFPYSAILGLWSLLLAVIEGILLGTISALNRNTTTDYLTMTIAMFGVSIPNFVLAPFLILFFAIWVDWFPAGGWGDGGFLNLALPGFTLGTTYIGSPALFVAQ